MTVDYRSQFFLLILFTDRMISGHSFFLIIPESATVLNEAD